MDVSPPPQGDLKAKRWWAADMSEASPLAAASPDALTALFEADPLTITDAQLTVLVTELRRRRNAFLSEEAAKSLKPKAKRVAVDVNATTPATLDKPTGEVSLDDLD